MKKILRSLLATIVGLLLLLILAFAIVTAFAIPIDLTRFKSPLEDLGAKLLGRPVQIEGPIVVATSLEPSFSLQGLQIQNPENFEQKDFLLMQEVRLQVRLLPLLKKKVHIPEFKVHNLSVTLEENEQEEVNWIFGAQQQGNADVAENTEEPGKAEGDKAVTNSANRPAVHLQNDSLVVEVLDLQDISVAYFGKGEVEPKRFLLSKCNGAMDVGQPMKLDIKGKSGDYDYFALVSLASLEEFLVENSTWVEIDLNIAETDFTMVGNLDLEKAARSLTLSTSVEGENLSSFGEFLRLDLPPFTPYKLTTELHIQKGQAELRKLKVETGVSSLIGNARIEKVDEKVAASLDLHSPLIQIDDFVFEDWSWQGAEQEVDEAMATEEVVNEKEQPVNENKHEGDNKGILHPEVLKKADCSLRVVMDKVESGEDFLGSGQLEVTLKDGRLNVAPLSLQLPGGGIDLEASLKPGIAKSEATLNVLIENFDIGILVRRSEPESDMGGNVNLRIDMSSSAASIPDLLRSGKGYFDFSGELQNFKAGVIDLWAVNLVSAIVSSTKNESQINCAVGRWSAQDGLLISDAFFVDTSKIRICADGRVNLKEEKLKIRVTPKAKKAEFFSLATPVKLQGTFADLHVKLGRGGVFGAAVKMIVSPVTTPLKRLFNDTIPSDGSDVCGMELGQENREEIFVPGCN